MQALLDHERALLAYRGYLPRFSSRREARSPVEVATHYNLPWKLFETALGGAGYSAVRHRFQPNCRDAASDRHNELLVSEALPSGGHLLDLGCGWGGGLLDVALESESRSVTAITISPSQAEAVRQRFVREVDSQRLQLKIGDFTDIQSLPDHVDAITMIESIEHVGSVRRAAFLAELHERYPNARLVLQVTARAGKGAEGRSRERGALVDLIFPGPGALPTVSRLRREVSAAGFDIVDLKDLSSEYVVTALQWMHGFRAAAERYQELGRIGRLFEAYAAATAASLDRGLARNVLLVGVGREHA
ncbi:class I SAM-dependent methyltransferase [Microbacterium sp.]|uniref:class I SAM-dependent methyltransferase n=1 Tax=Microbacterium sp. TaxID=51671 RepID=UPI003C153AF2